MGHVYIEAELGNPALTVVKRIKFLADTGATYVCIPKELADELELRIEGYMDVTLADGRKVRAGVALAYLSALDRHAIVMAQIFEVKEPLIEVLALEALRLGVDPVTGELKPTRTYAARA